jgi:hypothetical protein
MAPASIASGTDQKPVGRFHQRPPEDLEAAVECLADEEDHEHQALEHLDGGVRHVHAALDQTAGRVDAAEEDRDRDDGERVLPGEEGDEDAGEAVARGERGVGPALDRRHLEIAGEPGAGPGEDAGDDDELADGNPAHARADVAAR